MKIGTLCKVTVQHSHKPSQYGDFIVVLRPLNGTLQRKNKNGHITDVGTVVVGRNLNTGKLHHYFTHEIKEVKQ